MKKKLMAAPLALGLFFSLAACSRPAVQAGGNNELTGLWRMTHLQGIVEEIHPVLELFWVFGALGERRLIDFDTYTVTMNR